MKTTWLLPDLGARCSVGPRARRTGTFGVAQCSSHQASLASASTFAVGAALPLCLAWAGPITTMVPLVAGGSLLLLALLGGLAARAGGANIVVGAGRVTFWGTLAMAATAAVGTIFGTVA